MHRYKAGLFSVYLARRDFIRGLEGVMHVSVCICVVFMYRGECGGHSLVDNTASASALMAALCGG